MSQKVGVPTLRRKDMGEIEARRKREFRKLRRENGLCIVCGNPSETYRCKSCHTKLYNSIRECAHQKIYNQKIKDEVFEHYGGYVCSCCGETEKDFLCIDHINNDGAKHRKEQPKAKTLCKWLKINNFPQGFQVLCYNCNRSKDLHGECIHSIHSRGKNQ